MRSELDEVLAERDQLVESQERVGGLLCRIEDMRQERFGQGPERTQPPAWRDEKPTSGKQKAGEDWLAPTRQRAGFMLDSLGQHTEILLPKLLILIELIFAL